MNNKKNDTHIIQYIWKKRKRTINQNKEKLTNNGGMMISIAEKVNSIEITSDDEYQRKVMNFISNSNFSIVKNELNKKFQKRPLE